MRQTATSLDKERSGRWLYMLLPGYAEAEAGQPLRAFLAVLLPVALLTMPLVGKLGYRQPILFASSGTLLLVVSSFLLVIYLGARVWRWRI